MDPRTPFSPSRSNVGKDYKTPSKSAMSGKKPKQQVRQKEGLLDDFCFLRCKEMSIGGICRWTASFLLEVL